MLITNVLPVVPELGLKYPPSSQKRYHLPSTACGSYVFGKDEVDVVNCASILFLSCSIISPSGICLYFIHIQKALPRQGRERALRYSWYHLVSINRKILLILTGAVTGASAEIVIGRDRSSQIAGGRDKSGPYIFPDSRATFSM